MSKILVSIVCTNYNKGDWIAEAIESFLCQKANFEYEILLIDDKSTDHSPEIIKKYAKKYPKRIRAFYNKKNLGITKTWIKICKEAEGRYIARCDGDDYWIDDKKLQKQVNLLKKNKDSLWCCTDYDIINTKGEITHHSAVESNYINRPESYAEMLATKGFTMSSTWLVDAKLLRKINTEINASAIDDTFNIQLDLFNRTELSYLPEATVMYRVSEGSDSRPSNKEMMISRHKKLLETQLEYLKKYKNVDAASILEFTLKRDMVHEVNAIERRQIIQQQQENIVQQRDQIKNLEETIRVITKSRSYKLAALIKKLVNTPQNILKKIFS